MNNIGKRSGPPPSPPPPNNDPFVTHPQPWTPKTIRTHGLGVRPHTILLPLSADNPSIIILIAWSYSPSPSTHPHHTHLTLSLSYYDVHPILTSFYQAS